MDANNNEQMLALKEQMAALETRWLNALSAIGEKILPELADRPEYAALTAEAGDCAEKIAALKQRETELAAEIARREKEEKEALAKRTCVACKTVNPEGAQFCEECGAKLGELPREYCRACGTMNAAGMKFCGECGARLGETAHN